MNKAFVCLLFIVAPLCTFADNANYADMTNAQIQQHLFEMAQKNQNEYQMNLTQSLNEAAEKNEAAVQAAIKQSQEAEKPTSPTPSKPKPVEKCNCYSSSAYNFPANFRYNQKKIRIERIQPACECNLKDTPSYLSEESDNNTTAPLSVNNTSSNSDNNTQSRASDETDLTDDSSADTSSSNNSSSNNDNFGITYN
ncbi:MAG: hypothetical protein COW05_01125 [Gammaproteobacteria bacterium CG12_big_fil_rev_8_21_14_0_65_46_12]|nr:MAG: hypothetical protein COW05_01125 [Gammaproteobacteria bacterium CG12_big_fil_rev_8_21_14_0_65_46_12]